MEILSPLQRMRRVRHELRRRDVAVLRTERIGANFISITFGDESLSDFVSESFDDHVKFMFEDGNGEIVRRDYTPRRFDLARRELTIEFVVHGEGAACQWARRAAPGMRAMIGGPRGSKIVPVDFPWHLLVSDATGLPAVHRRLEELPSQVRAIVLVQTNAADRRDLTSAARLDVQWLAPHDDLVAQVRALTLPDTQGFAWGAGEAATMTQIRDVLVDEKHHPREAMRVSAYWKQGAGDFHEDL
jgi:NADPH-dependent ferric siderophore reductase